MSIKDKISEITDIIDNWDGSIYDDTVYNPNYYLAEKIVEEFY